LPRFFADASAEKRYHILGSSQFEAGFLSLAHSEKDIEQTVRAAYESFKEIPLRAPNAMAEKSFFRNLLEASTVGLNLVIATFIGLCNGIRA